MALVMLLACLAGCNGNTAPDDTTPSDGNSTPVNPDDTAAPAEQLKIVEGGVAKFSIVYPDTPGADLYKGVKSLAEAIEKATGAKISYKDDFIQRGKEHDNDTYEILVGSTNYPQTAEVLKELKYSDYAIVQSGHKIVVAAHTVETTIRAINYFCKNLIPESTQTDESGKTDLLFTPYTFYSKPAVASLTVAGRELKDYRIVYAKGEAGYNGAADLFAEFISERYGYVLEVIADTKSEPTDNEILIGPTNRTQSSAFMEAHPCKTLQYAMGVLDGRLMITGKPYSCLQAVNRFSSRYLFSGSDTVALPEGELLIDSLRTVDDVPRPEGTDVRIMTANILAEFETWGGTTPVARRAEIFAAVLDVYQPDAVGVQEVTDAWYRYLPTYVGDKYEFIYPKTPDRLTNYSSILYDKTKYDVVDSGLKYFSTEGVNNIRLVTWAVFSAKQGDTKFILFNTHWCWDALEHARAQAVEEATLIKQVTSKYPYPYFCTADYNIKQETEVYKQFLELTGAVDAKYAARAAGTLLNISGGCGNLGTPRGESGNSIDHIFMTATCEARAFATVTVNSTYDLSDHSPKYVDVKLK